MTIKIYLGFIFLLENLFRLLITEKFHVMRYVRKMHTVFYDKKKKKKRKNCEIESSGSSHV